MTESRKCLFCQNDIRGRSDKKFCHDQCRNDYNNQLKNMENNDYVRHVNLALRINRRILEHLMEGSQGLPRVHLNKLNNAGFKFKYFTHQHTTKKGSTYFYCYEYGYLPLENNWYLVVMDEKKTAVNEKSIKATNEQV